MKKLFSLFLLIITISISPPSLGGKDGEDDAPDDEVHVALSNSLIPAAELQKEVDDFSGQFVEDYESSYGVRDALTLNVAPALDALHESEKSKFHRASSRTRRCISWSSALLTLFAIFSTTEMWAYNSDVDWLFNINISAYVGTETPPYENIWMGSFVAVSSIPSLYVAGKNAFLALVPDGSAERSARKARSCTRGTRTCCELLPAATLPLFSILTYAEINSEGDMPPALSALVVFLGIPYAITQLSSAHSEVSEERRRFKAYKYTTDRAERKRWEMIAALKASFQEILQDDLKARKSWAGIQQLREHVAGKLQELEEEMDRIDGSVEVGGEKAADDAHERLTSAQKTLKQTAALYIARHLFSLGKDRRDEFTASISENRVKRCWEAVFGTHPLWHRLTQGLSAAILLGTAAVPMVYGWQYATWSLQYSIFGNTSHPIDGLNITAEEMVSYITAYGLAPFYVPYMAYRAGKAAVRVVRTFTDYNPNAGERAEPSVIDVTWKNTRGVASLMWYFRGMIAGLPYTFIGARGMGTGIGPIAPVIPLENQWVFLVANGLVYGSWDYLREEPYVQKFISYLIKKHSPKSPEAAKIHLARELKKLIKWARDLDPKLVRHFYDALGEDVISLPLRVQERPEDEDRKEQPREEGKRDEVVVVHAHEDAKRDPGTTGNVRAVTIAVGDDHSEYGTGGFYNEWGSDGSSSEEDDVPSYLKYATPAEREAWKRRQKEMERYEEIQALRRGTTSTPLLKRSGSVSGVRGL